MHFEIHNTKQITTFVISLFHIMLLDTVITTAIFNCAATGSKQRDDLRVCCECRIIIMYPG